LGVGADTLTLSSAGANSVNVSNTESILGAGAADTVVLLTALTGGTIDLDGERDVLGMGSDGGDRGNVRNEESRPGGGRAGAGANSVNVSNTESLLGAGAADTVVLLTALTGGTIDLGVGADTLSLSSAGANSVNVSNTESILGAGAADTVVLLTALTGGTID